MSSSTSPWERSEWRPRDSPEASRRGYGEGAMDVFGRTLDAGARRVGLRLSAEAVDRLEHHYALLVRWAPRVNLTSIVDPEAAAVRHGLDSLLFAELLPESIAGPVVDVGSGAGFPGVAIAVVRPEVPLVLLEPIRKRASFLRVVTAELGLDAVRVVEGRLDADGLRGLPGPVAGVVSRATLAPADLLARAVPHLGPYGFVVTSRGGPSASSGDLRPPPGLAHDLRRTVRLPGNLSRTLDRFRASRATED